MNKNERDKERFWKLVDIKGPRDCWEWQAAFIVSGYGTFKVGSLTNGTRRNVLAHRYSCEITKRPLGHGEQALHHCDNKRCVNPDHLYIGSRKDNARDAVARNRIARVGSPGVTNPKARLTEAQAIEIKHSSERNTDLARRFGISKTHVGYIKTGKSWSYLNAIHDLQSVERVDCRVP